MTYNAWMLSSLFLATVIGSSDGETLTVMNQSKGQVKIRLAEIDAPEAHQAFGFRSKQSLTDLCFGKQAEIVLHVQDRNKRTVARVKCAGVNANAEQVKRGMAWVSRQYAKDQNLYILENDAKAERRGLWIDTSPTPPWEFRKLKRHASNPVM